MSVTAVRSSAHKPGVPELMSRAGQIAEISRARVQEAEANRRIADDVIERLREAQLFRILQPAAYGGFEYCYDVFAELVAIIGRGCGSTAWVYGLGAVHQWFVACFPKEAQEEYRQSFLSVVPVTLVRQCSVWPKGRWPISLIWLKGARRAEPSQAAIGEWPSSQPSSRALLRRPGASTQRD